MCLIKLLAQTLLTKLTHLHSLDCDNFQHDQVSKISSERSGTPKKRKAPPPPISPTQVKTKANKQSINAPQESHKFVIWFRPKRNVLELTFKCMFKMFLSSFKLQIVVRRILMISMEIMLILIYLKKKKETESNRLFLKRLKEISQNLITETFP